MDEDYVQFGCGTCAPAGWRNFDAGPAFWLQKYLPLTKPILLRKGFPNYPVKQIVYADVIKGLPLLPQSVRAVYCSHVLEHLPLEGFRSAVRNVFTYLKPGGLFRIVLPDLEPLMKQYIDDPSPEAASHFLDVSYLGERKVVSGLGSVTRQIFGRSKHLWMWDYKAIEKELAAAGFVAIRRASFNDSEDARFREVEDLGRWEGQLGVECRRP